MTADNIVNNLWEFLTFKRFISIDALIVIYYFGALIMPLLSFYLINRYFYPLIKPFPKKSYKLYFILFFTIIFLCCELFLRMGFEAIIGYFQMIQNIKRI